MVETRFVIIRDECLKGGSESYPIAVFDDWEQAQQAMFKAAGDKVTRCQEGDYEEFGIIDTSVATSWCSVFSKESAYHISFRLCAVPYNALEFDNEKSE